MPSSGRLRSLVALVVPAYPAGSGPGPAELAGFLSGVLTRDRPDWADRVARLAAEAGTADDLRRHPDGGWFADLVPETPPWELAGRYDTVVVRTEPDRSVTDPWGRVWGHDNVRIVDGSVHVTNGGVNPVLTILAGALRIATDITRG